MGVALALPAAFYLFLQNFQTITKSWNRQETISLYLKLNTTESEIKTFINQLKNRDDIGNIKYISPALGLNELKKSMGLENVINTLQSNPLPPVIVIHPKNSSNLEGLVDNLKTYNLVDNAQFDLAWVKRLYYFVILGKRITDILVILFGIGIVIIIGNTIRLTTENHRQEITIFKLVGATPGFIRRPFLYCGFFYGLFGGLLSLLIVSLMLYAVASPLANLEATYNNHFFTNGLNLTLSFEILFFSIFIGLCGSWLAIYRHLKAIEKF